MPHGGETKRNSCGIIAGIAPPDGSRRSATAFRSYGHSDVTTGGAPANVAVGVGDTGRGHASTAELRIELQLVGAVSRELLAVETDNRLTIYTDQRRGIFKIIIVRYIRIAPGLATTTLKSDTISP